jgi:DNA replication protein DnaC
MPSVSAPATCPKCNGTGWVPFAPGSYDINACSCQEGSRRSQRIVAAKIPKRYLHCRLDSFHDRGLAQLIAARSRVLEFANGWMAGANHGRGLLLTGGCGSGKTHLAVAGLLEIIGSPKPGRLLFRNFQDLIQEIQASFDSDEVPSKSEILRPLLEADLLVLDELGSQKPSMFVQDILYYIINTRYNEERTTIFTTNLNADTKPTLTENIGERLRSRLFEMTEEVRMANVPDYRSQAARKSNYL